MHLLPCALSLRHFSVGLDSVLHLTPPRAFQRSSFGDFPHEPPFFSGPLGIFLSLSRWAARETPRGGLPFIMGRPEFFFFLFVSKSGTVALTLKPAAQQVAQKFFSTPDGRLGNPLLFLIVCHGFSPFRLSIFFVPARVSVTVFERTGVGY